MTARAIASGTISFGLVSIPIKLYSASNASAGVSFNMLHAKCGSRLKQQYICSKDGETVGRDDMTKGYEFARDEYVTITPEELKALEEQSTQTIEVTEFVPVEAIDPIYYDKTYYLGPDKGGGKAYKLLAEVLKRTGRVAIAKYAARGRGNSVMLGPEGGLAMQQLYFADDPALLRVPLEPGADVKESEIALARQLVEQRTVEKFDPKAYEDEVTTRIRAQLDRKIEGQEITLAPPQTGGGQIIDLMEALKASLEKGSRREGKRASSAPAPQTAARSAERKPARRAPGRASARAADSSKK
jgi:DNA end-binding protein Ku